MVALLAIPILLIAFQTLSSKEYQKEAGTTPFYTSLMNVFASVTGFIIIFAANGFRIRIQPEFVWIAVAVASCTLIYRECQVKAMSFGPVAVITIISFSAQSLGPFIYGTVWLNEPLTVVKTIGIILMLVSLLPLMGNDSCHIRNRAKFWINGVVVFVTGAISYIAVKMNQVVSGKEYTNDFISFYYLLFVIGATAIFAVNAFRAYKKHNVNADSIHNLPVKNKFNSKIIIFGLLIGAFNVTANIVSQSLASVLDASIQFPIMSSGQILSTVLLSMLFFKEMPTRNTVISMILNIASIILMSIK